MNQTWENVEKPNFGPDFGLFGPKLSPENFFVGFTSKRCKILSQAIIVCNLKENLWSKLKRMTKTSFWAWFRPVGPKFGPPIFFSKIWRRQLLDIMVSYHHVQYQKKLMIQSWSNLVTDGRTDGQTDRLTDESDFIGCCPNNVESPTRKMRF